MHGRHPAWRVSGIVVRHRAVGASPPTVVAAVESLLAGADAHVWFDESVGPEVVEVLEDPRVHVGAPPSAVLAHGR